MTAPLHLVPDPDDDRDPSGRYVATTDSETSRPPADTLSDDGRSDVDDLLAELVDHDLADDPMVDEYAAAELVEPTRSFAVIDGRMAGPDVEGDTDRRPVLPSWLTTSAGRRGMAAHLTGSVGYSAAFHGLRVPVYVGRLLRRSPIGIGRGARTVAHWAGDHAGDDLRARLAATAAATQSPTVAAEDLAADARHRRQVMARWVAVIVSALFGGWGIVGELTAWPGWQAATAVLVALLVAGWFGRDDRHPIRSVAVYTGAAPLRPDPSVVAAALAVIGIAPLSAALKADPDNALRFTGPAQRQGAGWRIDLDLPPGVTAGEVIDRRDKIAAALRRPLSCVWPEGDADSHEGRLTLYVSDRPLSAGGALTWVLAERGEVDLFEPVEIGVDQRGEPVSVVLAYAAGVLGGVPRMGKTWVLRLVGLCAALDRRAEVYAWDLKGTGDLMPLESVATVCAAGDEPEDMAAMLDTFRSLQRRMRARAKVIRNLPREVCPESKVTPALAERRDLDLRPIVVLVDECQLAFEHSDYGDELTSIAEDLVRRGPALGIWCWFATQRPDSKSLPSGIRDNAPLRMALKVMGQVANDAILGTSAYKQGIRATMFARRDLGVAILLGEGDDPVIVKTAAVDGVDATAIAERGAALRAEAGWSIEVEDLAEATEGAPEHCLAVWPGGDRVAFEDLAPAMASSWPALYGAWGRLDRDAVSRALSSALGPELESVTCGAGKGDRRPRGVRLDDLAALVGSRRAGVDNGVDTAPRFGGHDAGHGTGHDRAGQLDTGPDIAPDGRPSTGGER